MKIKKTIFLQQMISAVIIICLAAVSSHAQTVQPLPLKGDAALRYMIDGTFKLEHSPWNVEGTVSFKGNDLPPVFELQAPTVIKAFVVQADWNDSYHVDCSPDGQVWNAVWTAVPKGVIEGLVTRGIILQSSVECLFLRVRGGSGDGTYSVSEFQAFGDVPDDWVARLDPPAVTREWWPWVPFFDAQRVERLRLLLSMATLALASWLAALRLYRPEKISRFARYLLGALAVISFAAWSNFFQFHYDSPIHRHEFFHYYLGSKYAPQLSYNRLYRCAALADIESGHLKEDRSIRDLNTNKFESTSVVRAQPELCKANFTEGEWNAFKRDLLWFREHMDAASYEKVTLDHGFNGTPVWGILGALFSRAAPATSSQLYLLGFVDLFLMAGAFVFCMTTFGFIPTCIAIVFWGANFVASFSWTGNGFLRADWLAAFLVGLCFLKRRSFFWGGTFLMFSALSRLFPAVFLFGAMVTAAVKQFRSRSPVRESEILALSKGAVLSVVILIPLATFIAGHFSVWNDFVANTRKHAFNYSTNIIGVSAMLSVSAETWSHDLEDSSFTNPLERWIDAKKRIVAERKPFYIAYVLLVLAVMSVVLRRCEIWQGAILSGIFVSFVNVSNYDYYFLLSYAFLYAAAPLIPVGLLLLCASTWVLADAFSLFDQRYFSIGVAIHLFLFFTVSQMWRRKSVSTGEVDTSSSQSGG